MSPSKETAVKLKKCPLARTIALTVALALPGSVFAQNVTVPEGTRVFVELDQQVTSKKKHNSPGNIVKAHVWRDVVIDGRTVIETGSSVIVKISAIKPAKIAGQKGAVELEALQVSSVDGSDVQLSGGYGQSGKGRMALAITLAVVVFIPLIFIKGKQAKLPPGTVFDAELKAETTVRIPADQPPPVKPEPKKQLEVSVLYEILEEQVDTKISGIPLQIQRQGEPVYSAKVTHVNEKKIKAIPVNISDVSKVGEKTWVATASVALKPLGKHFTPGVNRFVVEADGLSDEVLFDLEL
jgi:hypothetical protein